MARGHGWLTPQQVDVLITIERIGAGCSMVAVTMTILSYWLIRKLRTTPNLFLLFASIANAGASVASMMGYDGLDKGEDSALCQAQAFIFQWFMQSDPWWSLAMAINVFLVFFCNASPSSFRKYAWIYLIICFGGPLVGAVALILVRHEEKGLIFGDAALWCWISQEWSLIRLWSYYIPVWFCILVSFIIYVAVGYHVFHTRNQLRNAALDPWNKEETSGSSPSGSRDSSEESLNRRTEFYGTVITEVQVTTDFSRQRCYSGPTIPTNIQIRGSPNRTRSWAFALDGDMYETTGESKHQRFETVCTSDRVRPPPSTVITRLRAVKSSASLKLKRLDPVKMAYLRTSFIFAFAVLITWIPSSINRLYSLSHGGKISFQLSVASGCVLPLQGAWNAVIYFTTSWGTVREAFKSAKAKLCEKSSGRSIRLESRLGTTRSQRHDTAAQPGEPCTTNDDCENGSGNGCDNESWDCANSV